MKKVYTEYIDGLPYIPLLYPNLGVEDRESILYMQRAFRSIDPDSPYVEIVDSPDVADYILLAHNYSSLKKYEDYVSRMAALAEGLGKQLLIFAHGDSDTPIDIPHAKVFRTSQYASTASANEILMPAYAEDLLESTEIIERKKGAIPIVGFCGWAQYKNLKNRVATYAKNILVTMLSVLMRDTSILARKKGISFRMRALQVLTKTNGITTNFIIRNSYSGHKKTISIDPEQARLEYRGNMLSSDFALVVKGDGNYSYRFYEALSLGRVPLLIDTDCTFPLEDKIDYDAFTIRIPFTDLDKAGDLLKERFHSMSNDDFVAMQHAARSAYEEYLRIDKYLAYIAEQVL